MIKNNQQLPEIDAEALKSAIIKSGISKADLAKKLCLSLAHVSELETGELKLFFNHRHKYFTALKLVKILGLSEVDIVMPNLSLDNAIVNVIDTASVADIPEAIVNQYAGKKIQKLRHRSFANTGVVDEWPPAFWLTFIHRQKVPIFLLTFSTIFFTIVLFNNLDGSSLLGSQGSTELEQRLPQAPTEDSIAGNQKGDETAIAPIAAPTLDANVAASNNQSLVANMSEASCQRGSDGRKAQFTPNEPLKPPNFVYIQSAQPASLCIEDAAGRIIKLGLNSNESKIVAVKAPVTIFSSNFSDLQIYFQGRKVGGVVKTAQELILSPAAIE